MNLQTINRPHHTYDQFTNNPIKRLLQYFLPLRIVRKLWTTNHHTITLKESHLVEYSNPYYGNTSDTITDLNRDVEIWLEDHIKHIKILRYFNEPKAIIFEEEETAALFRLTFP